MQESLPVFLSRLDFAWVTTLHILYPPLTIGLAILLFFAEWRWVRTGAQDWYRLVRFFEKLFIVNFAAGVATGITMEMAFGILYGPFSQAAGPFFGQVLGYETITAFMYEAGFIGLMIFGWGKISKGMHLFATFNVALSSSLSAMWILVANSWMQTPRGVFLKDGFFQVDDWLKALVNPSWKTSFPHMEVAAVELALCFVAGIAAWQILKGRHVALFRKALVPALLALVVIGPAQVLIGDEVGLDDNENKPAAIASMEGHYNTYLPNGQPDTTWNIVAWPNAKGDGMAWAIGVPHVLSLLETHSWNGAVKGLNEFPPSERPPVVIPFYAFRVMTAAGAAVVATAFWGAFLWLRRRLTLEAIGRNKWFLRAVILTGFMPYAAIWCGWWTKEIGRQPWVVYGMMTTEQGVSHMSVAEATVWLVGYVTFELIVWAVTWWFIAKLVRSGPDEIAEVSESHQAINAEKLHHHGPSGMPHPAHYS